MKDEKKFLQYSLIGLFTFPFIYMILCGLLCIKFPTLYPYIDMMLIIFVVLVVCFVGASYYFYKKLGTDIFFAEEEIVESKEEVIDEELTVTNIIGFGSVFVGDIQADNDVLVEGVLKGNITTKGNVFIGGTLEGNASCYNLAMHEGNIHGSVHCIDQAIVDEESLIDGDVHGYEINVSGEVKGSVIASQHVELTSTAIIGKDVVCTSVESSNGAIIKGEVKNT